MNHCDVPLDAMKREQLTGTINLITIQICPAHQAAHILQGVTNKDGVVLHTNLAQQLLFHR